MVVLRAATPDDAPGLAQLHVRVWRDTYRDLAPPEALARLDETRREEQWRAHLSRPAPAGAILAEEAGEVVGLVGYGPASNPVFAGRAEIGNLYVDAAQRGTGLGRRLMQAAFSTLAAGGAEAVGLAVVRQNLTARRFYAALGGVEVAEFQDAGPLWKSDNLLVVWPLPQ